MPSIHFCATATPITRSGDIDGGALRTHIDWLLSQGCDGVVLFGTTGEGASFGTAQKLQVLEKLLGQGLRPDQLWFAIISSALGEAVQLAQAAARLGCPLLITPPYYYPEPSDAGVEAFYAAIFDGVAEAGAPDLPIYLYHIPRCTGVALSHRLIAALAARYPGRVAGIKDSGRDLAHTRALLQKFPDLTILVGSETHAAQALAWGGGGTICGMSNVEPRLVGAALAAKPGALERLEKLGELLEGRQFVPALKGLLASRGMGQSWGLVRPPLVGLDDGDAQAFHREWEALAR